MKEEETYKGFTVMSRNERYGGIHQMIDAYVGEVYTFSLYAKSDEVQELIITYMTVGAGIARVIANGQTTVTVGTEWKHYSCVFTVTQAGNLGFKMEHSVEAGRPKFYVCGYKVEYGANPNPIWTPAPEDMILTKSDLKAFLDEYYAEKK